MADALTFPRLVYRGAPDTLGTGADAHGVALDSETRRIDAKEEWDAAQKDGWRLTREIEKADAADKKDAKK